jgi:threonine aldolase
MNMIDLRSDTVTRPTPAMRKAMAEAEVGDDVFGEDPTVNRLQERSAGLFEKEAALFVPTGCMANEIAVKLHTKTGDEFIIEERGHVNNFELGLYAMIGGTAVRAVRSVDGSGILTWDEIAPALRINPPYYSCPTGLICLENTHNMAGGTVMTLERTEEICTKAHELDLPVHLDGARLFNAAAVLDESVADLSKSCDSVMFSLSKGLGAPAGSVLLGKREFIEEARVWRKRLGGGMRQVGVLAAAGLVALEESPQKLHDDHANAKLLAGGLAGLKGVAVDAEKVVTNIVIFDVSATGMSSAQICDELKKRGILAIGFGSAVRMVTHYDVSRADIEAALSAMQEILPD